MESKYCTDLVLIKHKPPGVKYLRLEEERESVLYSLSPELTDVDLYKKRPEIWKFWALTNVFF